MTFNHIIARNLMDTAHTKRSLTPEGLNQFGSQFLPGHLGIRITALEGNTVSAELTVIPQLLAPNGFLHAGSVVTLADTACGYGCISNLPEGASSFTTIELKSNHLGTAREGLVEVKAQAVHLGRTTQVWDATVSHQGKTIALFRCTQMVLFPKEAK
ncbi:MAG: PaaI family thioesterase [Collimonas sp.]